MRKNTFVKPVSALLCAVMSLSVLGVNELKAAETNPSLTYRIGLDNTASDILEAHAAETEFVSNAYNKIFGRNADIDGLRYWVGRIVDGSSTAASVVQGFLNSQEFMNKGYDMESYLRILYEAVLGRSADATGLQYWMDFYNRSGVTRTYFLSKFVESVEFNNYCNSYGIPVGSVALTEARDINPQAAMFVRIAYTAVFDRSPDGSGLNYWTERLTNGSSTATSMINNLLNSAEFKAKNLSANDYVEVLYHAFMGRASDATGRAYWVGLIENYKVSNSFPVIKFAQSDEFRNVCNTYGITIGSLSVSEARDYNPQANGAIISAYVAMFGRQATVSEVNYWAELLHNGVPVSRLLRSLYRDGNLSSRTAEEQIIAIYASALGRQPSSTEVNNALPTFNRLGTSEYVEYVLRSQEYKNRYSAMGLVYDAVSGFQTSGGRTYYYENGAAVTGWRRFDGQRYYFDPARGGQMAVGWTYIDGLKYFFDGNGVLQQNVDGAITDRRFYLTVNTQTNTIMVYAYDSATDSYCIPVKAIVCSCGTAGNETIHGTFKLRRMNEWNVLMGNVWGQYCTQISGNFLFHSAWFYEQGNKRSLSVAQYNRLGENASHGCVRLTVADAMWIYYNCNGAMVNLFASPEGAPFDKPSAPRAVVVNGDYGYDPTDPGL